MKQNLQNKSESSNLLQVGLARFSAAEFLVALVLLIISSFFMESIPNGRRIEAVLMTVVLCFGVLAVSRKRRNLIMALILVTPAVVGKWMNELWPGVLPQEIVPITGLVFIVFVQLNLFKFILRAPRVNSEVLCAGISAYLLLGLLWGFAYACVQRVTPEAFALGNGAPTGHPLDAPSLLYFSFITLSTVGYGDIVPASNAARMLAATEAITGSLFVAVLIARLVGLYSAHPPKEQNDGSTGAK